jgi:hypothetical protein
MSTELLIVIVSALSILVTGIASALVVYFRSRLANVAKRDDPDFQKELEKSLLNRINEEQAQRIKELAAVTQRADDERIQRKVELADIKIEHKGELVAERLKHVGEYSSLLRKSDSLESRFDTFRVESETKYKTDTDALRTRVDTLEKIIKDLQQTVAGLQAENATLRREAGQAVEGGEG